MQELKTKLVVSSRGCSQHSLDKMRKARCNTWCAPAMRSNSMSLGTPLVLPTLPPCVEEHKFVQLKLPPWAEMSTCSDGQHPDTSVFNMETSLSQEEFGKADFSPHHLMHSLTSLHQEVRGPTHTLPVGFSFKREIKVNTH